MRHSPVFTLMLVLALVVSGACTRTSTGLSGAPAAGYPEESLQTREGVAALSITCSLKTPTSRYYLFEVRSRRPDVDAFPFEVHIDGRKVVWTVKGETETTPIFGPHGRLPEGGEGIRFVLRKTVHLPPGPHHIVFSIPFSGYSAAVDVLLQQNRAYELEFRPVYAVGRKGYRTFFRGIGTVHVFFDNVRIR